LSPPFTLMIWPVILAAPGPQRNTVTGAMSAGVGRPRPARLAAVSIRLWPIITAVRLSST
jgi:hypothetical protein